MSDFFGKISKALEQAVAELDVVEDEDDNQAVEPDQVQLYAYDVSFGLAQMVSSSYSSIEVDGIWHTSIVVFHHEYHFGRTGIICSTPKTTEFGKPTKIYNMGTTRIRKVTLEMFLSDLRRFDFAPGKYNLITNNCNTLSNRLANFLIGRSIPTNISELPTTVAASTINGIHRAFGNTSQSSKSNRRSSRSNRRATLADSDDEWW